MTNNKKRMMLIGISCMLLFLMFALPVLAAGGTGSGSGGGGGSKSESSSGDSEGNTPLTLEASEPKDGTKNVAVDAQIKLTFSKNVVNMQVKDANIKCFSMQDSKGQAVLIDIKMADDQMEPEGKNDAIIVPRQPLAEGETYTVAISQELSAKNGAKLEKATKVSFSTVGQKESVLGIPLAIVVVILIGGYLFFKNKKK